MSLNPAATLKARRRGTVLAVLVVIMALMGLMVVGVIRPLQDESEVTRMRVETVRAFYAAESGATVLIQSVNGLAPEIVEGTEISMVGQRVRFTMIPEGTGAAWIEGVSGESVRRIELEVQ